MRKALDPVIRGKFAVARDQVKIVEKLAADNNVTIAPGEIHRGIHQLTVARAFQCNEWLKGRCRRGKDCSYSHELAVERPEPSVIPSLGGRVLRGNTRSLAFDPDGAGKHWNNPALPGHGGGGCYPKRLEVIEGIGGAKPESLWTAERMLRTKYHDLEKSVVMKSVHDVAVPAEVKANTPLGVSNEEWLATLAEEKQQKADLGASGMPRPGPQQPKKKPPTKRPPPPGGSAAPAGRGKSARVVEGPMRPPEEPVPKLPRTGHTDV